MKEKQRVLSRLPKIDVFLARPNVVALADSYSAALVKEALQAVLHQVRQAVLTGLRTEIPENEELEAMISGHLKKREAFRLRRLINGTGTVLHTNLGRSVLSKAACRHVAAVAGCYSNLEYNLEAGSRGSRYSHLTDILRELTGAEDVLVVNNNAAAVMLALNPAKKLLFPAASSWK